MFLLGCRKFWKNFLIYLCIKTTKGVIEEIITSMRKFRGLRIQIYLRGEKQSSVKSELSFPKLSFMKINSS